MIRHLALALLLALAGCAHNLQGPFVASMEDYHAAIDADRAAGIYAMDSTAIATHEAAARAIAAARRVIDEAGEGSQ